MPKFNSNPVKMNGMIVIAPQLYFWSLNLWQCKLHLVWKLSRWFFRGDSFFCVCKKCCQICWLFLRNSRFAEMVLIFFKSENNRFLILAQSYLLAFLISIIAITNWGLSFFRTIECFVWLLIAFCFVVTILRTVFRNTICSKYHMPKFNSNPVKRNGIIVIAPQLYFWSLNLWQCKLLLVWKLSRWFFRGDSFFFLRM